MTSFEKEYGPSPKKKSRRQLLVLLLILIAFTGGFVVFASNGDLGNLTESVVDKLAAIRPAPADQADTSGVGESVEPTGVGDGGEPAGIDAQPTGGSAPRNDSELGDDGKTGVEPEIGELVEPTVEALQARIDGLEAQILIDHAIRAAPSLAGADVWVMVQGDSVALTGSVVSDDQVEAAKRLAAAAVKNAMITTSLTIADPASAPADPGAALRRRVEGELDASGAFHLPAIRVSTQGGVVTLSGSVRAKAERLLAQSIAEGVPGVAEVHNELEVRASPVAPTATAPTATGHLSRPSY